MITNNVISRTFFIQYGDGQGTCFAIDYEEKQYLITAKHVVEGIANNNQVSIYHESKWNHFPVQIAGLGEGNADVAVLVPPFQLSPKRMVVTPTSVGLIYGQDVYFLGFPYGMFTDHGKMCCDLPTPFVKKAIVSSLGGYLNKNMLFLDGHNNQGFSGGPVIFSKPGKLDYHFAGIISGYKCVKQPVYDQKATLTQLFLKENTGIVYCWDIEVALDIIRERPIGSPIIY